MKVRISIIKFVLFTVLIGIFSIISFNEIVNSQKVVEVKPTPFEKKAVRNESQVIPIGRFMKVKSDGEHASGFDIRLWKQDENIYGMINYHRGLMGDPPAGLLEDVKFDPKTNKFLFRAKLSVGLTTDKDNKWISSHDIFEFEGTLTNKKIQGNLVMKEEICGEACLERKRIKLPYSKEWSEYMETFQTYEEWKSDIDKILERRGPQW